ncbi:MAG: glycosyltransferase family 9 protein [Candidatus Gastranaerophilales bacterium]|nr:glycosyltransferase family 9 protein [Candidatus Gastranaerophilales bacterium]
MKNYKNILFINYGGIGDEILFLPTIDSIKKEFPNAKITLALEPRSKSIQNLTNKIDEVICVDIKALGYKKYFNILKFIIKTWFKNFDCVISSGKNPLVAVILFLTGIKERIGYDSKTSFLLTKKVKLNENQYAGQMYHDLAKPIINGEYQDPNIEIIGEFELNPELKKEEYICIHPGVSKMSISKNILKCPSINFWNNLIEGLLNKGKQVVLLGTKDDKDLIEEILKNEKIKQNPNFINYYNKTKNIMEMAFIMKNSNKVICVDSAPLHVAVCVKSNIFAIFGPTSEIKLVPKRENILIIKNDIECRPCLWHKRACNCENSKCLNIDYNLILDKIN